MASREMVPDIYVTWNCAVKERVLLSLSSAGNFSCLIHVFGFWAIGQSGLCQDSRGQCIE